MSTAALAKPNVRPSRAGRRAPARRVGACVKEAKLAKSSKEPNASGARRRYKTDVMMELAKKGLQIAPGSRELQQLLVEALMSKKEYELVLGFVAKFVKLLPSFEPVTGRSRRWVGTLPGGS